MFLIQPDDVEILDVSSRMRLSGRMAIRAFLHPRATVAEAVEAIKTDLLKSLNARCEMPCDSLVGEEVRGAGDEVNDCCITFSSKLTPRNLKDICCTERMPQKDKRTRNKILFSYLNSWAFELINLP